MHLWAEKGQELQGGSLASRLPTLVRKACLATSLPAPAGA